jgi:hypothetical protein
MKRITRDDVRALAEHQAPGCVSVYLPTHPAGREVREDPVHLKNLLREAEKRLADAGFRSSDIDRRLDPVRGRLNDMAYWRHQDQGLALFIADGFHEVIQLPEPPEEMVHVNQRFYLKPLYPLLVENVPFFLLAISKNDVRLFAGDRFGIRQLDLPEGVPADFAEVTAPYVHQRHVEFHTGAGQKGQPGRRAAVFHGQGGAGDKSAEKKLVLEFCQRVSAGIQGKIQRSGDPLILAAAEPIAGIYREANSYPHLLDTVLSGNPDRLQGDQLHQKALEVVEPLWRQDLSSSADRQQQMADSQHASRALPEVLRAVHNDQVASLFVAFDQHAWGTYDPETSETEVHPRRQEGDDDLLDVAARRALLSGSDVYAVPRDQMPQDTDVCATFRFAFSP